MNLFTDLVEGHRIGQSINKSARESVIELQPLEPPIPLHDHHVDSESGNSRAGSPDSPCIEQKLVNHAFDEMRRRLW